MCYSDGSACFKAMYWLIDSSKEITKEKPTGVFTCVGINGLFLKYLKLPPWSRVILEKVIVVEVVRISTQYGTNFIALFIGHYPGAF